MKNKILISILFLFIILIFGLIILNRKKTKINIDKIFNNIMTNNKFKKYTPVLLNNDPWIITLDSFLNPEECKE